MGFTRRDFLSRVGQAGGYSAAFLAMQGLGLIEANAATVTPIEAAPASGKGVSIVVAGGGIAGLVSAYELRALGYTVTLLEARERPGGRNYSVRGGDTVTFLDGSKQQCSWDAGHYQNFGPARLPSIHPNILAYCKKLGVELQVEVNMTNSAHLQNDNAMAGKPVVMRQAVNDTRGHVSELLSKSIHQGALDQDLSKEDRDRMLTFLRTYGSLDEAGKYNGSDRAGYSKTAGAGDDTGVLSEPIDMHTLLDASFWQGMLFDQAFDMQATMFQPVGGMDRIPLRIRQSLLARPSSTARPSPKSARLRNGVRIALHPERQRPKSIEAEYCVCAVPLHHSASKIRPTIFRRSIQARSSTECVYASAYKVAWESRRFWEQDYNIYGGLEFVNVGCSPIWFPSAGTCYSERGVRGQRLYRRTPTPPFSQTQRFEEKFAEESRKSIERLHPGHGKELEKPMYVSWGKMPYNEGSWIRAYGPNQDRSPGVALTRQTGQGQNPGAARTRSNPGYETLIQPDGRIIFAGDHVSHIVAWQEGAIVSAQRAVQQVADQVKSARLATSAGTIWA